MQERRNSIANTLELCFSYINPLIYKLHCCSSNHCVSWSEAIFHLEPIGMHPWSAAFFSINRLPSQLACIALPKAFWQAAISLRQKPNFTQYPGGKNRKVVRKRKKRFLLDLLRNYHTIWNPMYIIIFLNQLPGDTILIHWGRVRHICICKLTIIGSDNGLLPGWCQAIIWKNAGILLIVH